MAGEQADLLNPQVLKLAGRLQESGDRTRDFFAQIPPAQWGELVYSDGMDWNVKHILAHFVVTESEIARLIKYILQGSPGVSEDFDIDAFNQREVNCFSKLPTGAILQRFLEKRAETVALVSALRDADLAVQGRHPWLGVAPIEDMIKLLYRHNQIHQRDIRKTLESSID